MHETLIALYDSFYQPPEMAKTKAEIDEAHQTLVERLEKPERRLVLKIIDGKDRIAEDLSEDSFISGFQLAWQLANELNQYQKGRRSARTKVAGLDACSVSEEDETT